MVFSPSHLVVIGEAYHAFLFGVMFSSTLRCNTNVQHFVVDPKGETSVK
jgi:hypothetical protein